MLDESGFYSCIDPIDRSVWSDADLSGAIWDEGVHRAGGYSFTAQSVTELPFGFRAVLAEGCVRAHVENDGLATTIWNHDGVEYFEIARNCHEQFGSVELARVLDEIIDIVRRWQSERQQSPRAVSEEEFRRSSIGIQLDAHFDRLASLSECGFITMMKYLREHPELFV